MYLCYNSLRWKGMLSVDSPPPEQARACRAPGITFKGWMHGAWRCRVLRAACWTLNYYLLYDYSGCVRQRRPEKAPFPLPSLLNVLYPDLPSTVPSSGIGNRADLPTRICTIQYRTVQLVQIPPSKCL